MTRTRLLRQAFLFERPILLIGTTTVLAQSKTRNGILKIHVNPKQAYVFVDDTSMSDGSQAIALDAGIPTPCWMPTSYGSARRHPWKVSKKRSVCKAGRKIPQSLPINERGC